MLLDELVGIIETLKERIRAHRLTLSANEYRTRVSLIDPLLCALGWDVSDPEQVALEFDISGKRVDYALKGHDDRALVLVEAKRLGESLTAHQSQVLLYATEQGVQYPVLTNGDNWIAYGNSKLVPVNERRILNVTIGDCNPADDAEQFSFLSRDNVSPTPSSKSPSAVEDPHTISPVSTVQAMPTNGSKEVPIASQQPQPTCCTNSRIGWTRLVDLVWVKGLPPPSAVEFGGFTRIDIMSWKQLLIEVAESTIRSGHLTAVRCPIPAGPQSRLNLVQRKSWNPTSIHFQHQRKLSNDLYLATHFTPHSYLAFSKYLLQRLSVDPSQVWLKTG